MNQQNLNPQLMSNEEEDLEFESFGSAGGFGQTQRTDQQEKTLSNLLSPNSLKQNSQAAHNMMSTTDFLDSNNSSLNVGLNGVNVGQMGSESGKRVIFNTNDYSIANMKQNAMGGTHSKSGSINNTAATNGLRRKQSNY